LGFGVSVANGVGVSDGLGGVVMGHIVGLPAGDPVGDGDGDSADSDGTDSDGITANSTGEAAADGVADGEGLAGFWPASAIPTTDAVPKMTTNVTASIIPAAGVNCFNTFLLECRGG